MRRGRVAAAPERIPNRAGQMVPSQLEEPHGPSSECHWALAAREGFKGVMGHLESRQFWGWISIYNLSG